MKGYWNFWESLRIWPKTDFLTSPKSKENSFKYTHQKYHTLPTDYWANNPMIQYYICMSGESIQTYVSVISCDLPVQHQLHIRISGKCWTALNIHLEEFQSVLLSWRAKSWWISSHELITSGSSRASVLRSSLYSSLVIFYFMLWVAIFTPWLIFGSFMDRWC